MNVSIEKYISAIGEAKASDYLKEKTVRLMSEKKHSMAKCKPSRLLISAVTAAIVVSLLGIGAVAYKSGWLRLAFGESADNLLSDGTDYSARFDNIEIWCSDSNLSFELTSAYVFDELLFYELNVSRKDGTPFELPEDFYPEFFGGTWDGGFSCENIGDDLKLSSGAFAECGSVILGESENGGINILCNVYSTGGFAEGNHIHLVLEGIKIWRPQVKILSSAAAEIEFDISELPKSNKCVIDVNKTARFADGQTCVIKSISLSPMCVVVTAASSDGNYLEHTMLRENRIVLKSGDIFENCGINANTFGSEEEVFLFWFASDAPNRNVVIMPDEIASVQLGDIVIDCDI